MACTNIITKLGKVIYTKEFIIKEYNKIHCNVSIYNKVKTYEQYKILHIPTNYVV